MDWKLSQMYGKCSSSLPDRYWGASSPYANLTTETLQYLNLEQSIADLVHFAKTVNLPFDTDRSSNADNAVSRVIKNGSSRHPHADGCFMEAMGTHWGFLQRCSSRVDRIDCARDLLGVPCIECARGGYL
jgi:hypothetical protein